jgi:hypothetical protein
VRWKEIIYLKETSTAGSTSAGNVATVVQQMGGIQRRPPIGVGFDPNGDWGVYQSSNEKQKKSKKNKNKVP